MQQQQPTMAQRRQRMTSQRAAASSGTTNNATEEMEDIPTRRQTSTSGATTGQQSQAGPQPRQRAQTSQAEQTQPLHNGNATQLGSGAVEWKAFGQTVYVRDATKHPAAASYSIAAILGLASIGAIFVQMGTTYFAFSNMVFIGKIWEKFSLTTQNASRPIVLVACALIAVSFQAPLIYLAFKIDKRFASERHNRLSFAAKLGKVVDITKQIIADNLLLSIWAFIAIIADTIGDVSFIGTYTDSSIFLFFYATGLYGLSTIGLSEALQMTWDGMVTSEWMRHVKAANDYAAMTVANAAKSRGGR